MKNTFVKVLSLVMALMMVVGTFSTLAVFAEEECAHTNSTAVGDPVAPTCVDFGYQLWLCNDCGEEWGEVTSLPVEDAHKWTEKDAIAADCNTNERTAGRECEYCGEKEGIEEIKDTQKKHVFEYSKTAPDCTNPAMWVYKCTECGQTAKDIWDKKKDVEIDGVKRQLSYRDDQADEIKKIKDGVVDPDQPALGHKWYEEVVEPQFNPCKDGYVKYFCERCPDEDKAKAIVIPVEHKYEIFLNPVRALCTEYGADAKKCIGCNEWIGTKNTNKTNCAKVVWENGEVKADAGYNVIATSDSFDLNNYDADDFTITAENFPLYRAGVRADETVADDDKYKMVEANVAWLSNYKLAVGDATYVPSTCEKVGFALIQCKCGAIYPSYDTKLAEHDFSDPTTNYVDYAENCTEATIRYSDCKNCDYAKEEVLQAAAADHNWKSTVVDPKCGTAAAMGYTEHVCQNTYLSDTGVKTCTAENYRDNYKDALKCVYTSYEVTAGICGGTAAAGNALVFRAVCDRCNGKSPAGWVPSSLATLPTTHVKTTVTVPATCQVAAYTYDKCSFCTWNNYDATNRNYVNNPDDKDEDAHVWPDVKEFTYIVNLNNYDKDGDASNKVAPWTIAVIVKLNGKVAGENGSLLKAIKALPTCDTEGEVIVAAGCACGGTKTMTIPALGHDPEFMKNQETVGHYITVVDTKDADDKDIKKTVVIEAVPFGTDPDKKVALAPTCQNVGYMADGEICILCQKVFVAPTVLEKDPYNHAGKSINVVSEHRSNTCASAAYDVVYTDCCGESKQWNNSNGKNNSWYNAYTYDVTTAKHQWTFMPYADASCTKAGNHSYIYCATCKFVYADTIHDSAVTPTSGTNANAGKYYIDDVEVTGWNKTQQCPVTCEANALDLQLAGETVIAKAKHTWVKVEEVKATCTTDGYVAYRYCSVCGAGELNGVVYNKIGAPKSGASYIQPGDVASNTTELKSDWANFKQKILLKKLGHDYQSKAAADAICGQYSVIPNITLKTLNPTTGVIEDYKVGDDVQFVVGTNGGKYCSRCNHKQGNEEVVGTEKYEELWKADATAFDKIYDALNEYYTNWANNNNNLADKTDWTNDDAKGETGAALISAYWNAERQAAFAEQYNPDYADNGHNFKVEFVNLKAKADGKIPESGKVVKTVAKDVATYLAELKEAYTRIECTKKAYIIIKCVVAGCDEHGFEFVNADTLKTAHDYNAMGNLLRRVPDSKTEDCAWAYYDVLQCTVCGHEDLTITSDIMHHYDDKGVAGGEKFPFDFSCTGIASWVDKTCAGCGLKLTYNKDAKTYHMGSTEIKPKHTITTTMKKDETCSENGYLLEICKACNVTISKEIIDNIPAGKHVAPKANNEYGYLYDDYKAPTATEAGYAIFTCTICKTKITETIAAEYIADTVVTLNNDTFVAGGTIKATVSVSSPKVEFNKLFFTVSVPAGLTLSTNPEDLMLKNIAGAQIITDGDVVVADGVATYKFVIYAENDAEGNTTNVTFAGGEDVVLTTLVFEISAKMSATKQVISSKATNLHFWCTDAECEELIKVQKTDKDAVGHMHGTTDKDTIMLTDAPEAKEDQAIFAVVLPGNFNGDNTIGANDLTALLTGINNANVSEDASHEVYDMNRDGIVDDNDFVALRKFILKNSTAAAYTEMINDDIFEALDAYMASSSAILPDYDNNGSSAAEKLDLINEVKKIAAMNYVDYLNAYADMEYAEIFTALVVALENAKVTPPATNP